MLNEINRHNLKGFVNMITLFSVFTLTAAAQTADQLKATATEALQDSLPQLATPCGLDQCR